MSETPVQEAFSKLPETKRIFPNWMVAVPRIERNSSGTVFMDTVTPGATIYFTVDGTEPTQQSRRYIAPFKPSEKIKRIRALAVTTDWQSFETEARFFEKPNDWKVVSNSGYSYQYTGGGDDAIIDGMRGTTNFTAGEWQGYQGKTFEAVIDLQRETTIKFLGGGFLQVVRSWIWMPDRIEFEVSNDGTNYTRVAEIKPNYSQQNWEPVAKEFTQEIKPVKARYVRVKAYNIGKIPSWHPGAGGDPWIFVDEIFIK